jgi:hypothetical protein
MPAPTTKNFATGHFDVVIDSHEVTAYVKSVDGGLIKATSTEESMGPYHIKNRHLATREIDPLTIEMGASGGRWALDVLDKFVARREHTRHTGSIKHADANLKEQYEYTFKRALVTEITFPPKLDANGKDFATIKVKMQPEEIDFKLGEGPQFSPAKVNLQKQWMTSAFRLNIDGLDTNHVTSIEPLTFKIGTKIFKKGGFKLPEYMPTKLEMPKLSFMMPMKFAGSVIEWFRGAVAKEGETAGPDASYEKNGSIEILDSSHKKTVYEIELYNMGPETFSIQKSEANKAETKLCKFEAYITSVKCLSIAVGMI